jgi:hypothetical protein
LDDRISSLEKFAGSSSTADEKRDPIVPGVNPASRSSRYALSLSAAGPDMLAAHAGG